MPIGRAVAAPSKFIWPLVLDSDTQNGATREITRPVLPAIRRHRFAGSELAGACYHGPICMVHPVGKAK